MRNAESRRFVRLVAALAMTGCAGELEHPERFGSCQPGYVEQLFVARCGQCHDAETPQGGLDLVSAPMPARLVDVPADETGPCSGRTLISSDGDHLLIEKLEGASCGSVMPLAAAPLSRSDLDCVRQWIDATAGSARTTIKGAP